MKDKPIAQRIVCIGGGTGTFVTLRGLKDYPYHLSAIVTMADSGGSNKRIRDEFGLLPTSDIRQCFVALSDENGGVGLLRKLFMYRFEKGNGISGMTFGNLFMAALSDILGSQAEAIAQTRKVLRIKGTVIPVSYTNTNLFAEYEDGHIVREEHLIDEPPHDGKLRITRVYLKPQAQANPEALEAIKRADMIVLGPGDLYTSLIPNLLVSDVAHTIKNSKAKKVYVLNLMTKWGQTYNFTASDHIAVLEKYVGNTLDAVIVNSHALPASALALYAKQHELPVVDDLKGTYFKVIRAPVAATVVTTKTKSDTLTRSLIRHDSARLAGVLVRIAQYP
mgnify:FL=1